LTSAGNDVIPSPRSAAGNSLLGGTRALAPFVALAACATAPNLFGGSSYTIGLGVTVCIWIILALSYTVTLGLAGQFSVAHAALYGVGAYVTAILMTKWGLSYWATIPLGIVAGAALGAFIGLPAWRLSGDYVALVTLGAGVIAQEIMLNWTSVTGGRDGVANVPIVTLFGYVFRDPDYYVTAVVATFAVLLVVLKLRNSDLGRSWLAIREDELAAQAMGIRTAKLKVLSFAVGGGLAAVAGGLYAVFNAFVSSVGFGLTQSVNVLLIVLLGGLGRIWAAVIAAVVLTVVTAEFTTLSDISVGLYGFLMLMVIMFRGGALGGVIGQMNRWLGRLFSRARASVASR
jgi:branched-chain amino acid transport system permease protein